MYCENCGKKISSDSKFCSWCGKKVLENDLNNLFDFQTKVLCVLSFFSFLLSLILFSVLIMQDKKKAQNIILCGVLGLFFRMCFRW